MGEAVEKKQKLQKASRQCFASLQSRVWTSWVEFVSLQRLMKKSLMSHEVRARQFFHTISRCTIYP